MIRKCLATGRRLSLFLGSLAFAEPQRTFFIKENRMPGPFKAEVGAIGQYAEIPDDQCSQRATAMMCTSAAPYVRYGSGGESGRVSPMSLTCRTSRVDGDTEQGLGDVVAGAEFVVFQDIFGYPFIMPHVEVELRHGRRGQRPWQRQNALHGRRIRRNRCHGYVPLALDARYTFNEKVNDGGEDKNIATFAGSLIWDLSEQFSLIAKPRASERQGCRRRHSRCYFQGGFGLPGHGEAVLTFSAAARSDADEDVVVGGKIAYSF